MVVSPQKECGEGHGPVRLLGPAAAAGSRCDIPFVDASWTSPVLQTRTATCSSSSSRKRRCTSLSRTSLTSPSRGSRDRHRVAIGLPSAAALPVAGRFSGVRIGAWPATCRRTAAAKPRVRACVYCVTAVIWHLRSRHSRVTRTYRFCCCVSAAGSPGFCRREHRRSQLLRVQRRRRGAGQEGLTEECAAAR